MAEDASFEAEIYELKMNDLWMGNAENRANLASWLDLADWLYGSCNFWLTHRHSEEICLAN